MQKMFIPFSDQQLSNQFLPTISISTSASQHFLITEYCDYQLVGNRYNENVTLVLMRVSYFCHFCFTYTLDEHTYSLYAIKPKTNNQFRI